MSFAATTGKLLALMAVFVLAGIPLVAYLWETLNGVLALEVEATRLLIAAPVLLLLIGLLWLMARRLRRLTETQNTNS